MTRKIIIYMGQDITPLIMLNKVVPYLLEKGITPEVHIPAYHGCARTKIREYEDISFYEDKLTYGTIYPYVESFPSPRQTIYTMRQLAKRHGLNIIDIDNVNKNAAYLQGIHSDPTILGAISLFCVQIFKDEIIRIIQEKGFFWNLHPGLLPHIRGLSAPFWAMKRGDAVYGPTLHHVNAGIDEGRVLRLERLPVNPKLPYFLHRVQVALPAARMITAQLDKELNGEHDIGWLQDHALSTYYTYPTGPEIREFEASGLKMFATPPEMARMYLSFFKPDDAVAARELQNIIVGAIAAHEAAKQRDVATAA